MLDPVANFADSTVATAPSPATSGTSVVLANATPFPDPATYGAYNVAIYSQTALPTYATSEIVRVTAKSSNTLTITRAQEGTSARTIVVGDRVSLVITKKMIDDIQNRLNYPEGFLLNGRISRTVVSNDLVVAIKTLSGADPSTSNPVYVMLDDAVYSITAALSVTLADGTNYAHAGDTGNATFPMFWRAFIVNDSGTLRLGISRKGYGHIYSEYSSTNTGNNYMALSAGTPAAGSRVTRIGYFNATLSATAAFTWSVPTLDTVQTTPDDVDVSLAKPYAITVNTNLTTAGVNIGAFTVPESGFYEIVCEVGITNQSVDAEERLVDISVKKGTTTLKSSSNYIKNIINGFNEFTHCSIFVPSVYIATTDTINVVGTTSADSIFKTTNSAAAHTFMVRRVDHIFNHI